ncbi:Gem-associated protein 5 [Tyrophagus putrescentiae]|nr:Gem-associated protein 5 [Tyrophagus putrescentiae]
METEKEEEISVPEEDQVEDVAGDDPKKKTAESEAAEAEVETLPNLQAPDEVLTPSSAVTGIEYSFGTFFNWFMPSCMDLWTTEDNFAKTLQSPSPSAASNYGIHYRDLVNVFGHSASKKFTDVFRSTNAYVTTVVFEKTRDFVGRSASASNFESHGPRVFVGNSEGSVAVYDLHRRSTLLQDLPLAAFKRPCCRKVPGHSKILSAAWMHFRAPEIGSVVFYPLDCHLVRWEVDQGRVEVVHFEDRQCGGGGGGDGLRLFGQLPISCLVAMSAEATADRAEHRLAVGFNGGKLAILSFNASSGQATALVLLTDASTHHDDICSLAFSPVWSIGDGSTVASEIAEYRISSTSSSNNNSGSSGGSASSSNSRKGGDGQHSKCNWFAAAFLPRSALGQSSSNSASNSASNSSSSAKPPSYEILVTAPTGELVSLALPDRAPSSKLRIAKASRFASSSSRAQNSKKALEEDDHQGHQSVVFSIMVCGRRGIAVTYSLDYKMILWELGSRTARGRFHLFANGALAIDCCLRDRRLAVAFGSSVYALDFGGGEEKENSAVSTTRLTTAPKAWKFYQVSWNNVSDSERLGRWRWETRAGGGGGGGFSTKNLSGFAKGVGDASKIYKFVWPVKVAASSGEPPRTAVLSLHASGAILINFVPSRHLPNRPAENFMTAKYVSGLPTIEGGGSGSGNGSSSAVGSLLQQRKHSALDGHQRGGVLVVGNDDGTVDLLKSVDGGGGDKGTPPYRHLYRFRAFTKPIISIEASGDDGSGSGGGLWLAITAMHDNFVHCYRLEVNEEEPSSSSSILKPLQLTKYKLSGHSDRVAATSWSPFSSYSSTDNQQQKKLLVTASYDTSCIVWEVVSQRPLHRFTGHRSLIYAIRWSHFREELIFSGGEDAFHAWRWPEQPKFEDDGEDVGDNPAGVTLVKLREVLKKKSRRRRRSKMKKRPKKMRIERRWTRLSPPLPQLPPPPPHLQSPYHPPLLLSSKAVEAVNSHHHHHQTTALPPAKALFSLSNQLEYSSSKAETLEDIAAIVRLKRWADSISAEEGKFEEPSKEVPEEVVPERALKRILFYSPRLTELRRFLELERANHLQANSRAGAGGGGQQSDAAELISMMTDLRGAIERAIEEGEADLQLATYASAFSRDLYLRCLDAYWKRGGGGGSARLLLNYGREMEALSRLAVFGDFEAAVEGLIPRSAEERKFWKFRKYWRWWWTVPRGAGPRPDNLASQPTVDGLWERWFRARVGHGPGGGGGQVSGGQWAVGGGARPPRPSKTALCGDEWRASDDSLPDGGRPSERGPQD